jgi:hypothetical protein
LLSLWGNDWWENSYIDGCRADGGKYAALWYSERGVLNYEEPDFNYPTNIQSNHPLPIIWIVNLVLTLNLAELRIKSKLPCSLI